MVQNSVILKEWRKPALLAVAVLLLYGIATHLFERGRMNGARDMHSCIEFSMDGPWRPAKVPSFTWEAIDSCYRNVIAGERYAAD